MNDKELRDRQGRRIDSLRVSVTDRCNFRCAYCMPPEGLPWLPKEHLLRFEEIARLVRVFASLGIRKIRITGGEPLVRRDLPRLVAMLAEVPGIEDLALTTNGILLDEQAAALQAAGLRRLNVSLDSLTRETFEEITRRDALDGVLRGLEAAARHFDGPVKVNAVLLRGVNDHEIPAFAALARARGYEVRFIEFMPLEAHGTWSREALIPGSEVLERIRAQWELRPDPDAPATAPSRDWVFADGAPGKVGFIDSVSKPFCDSCNRIRITSDGKLRTCLFSLGETDLMGPLRDESASVTAADEEIARRIRRAVWNKEPGHKINDPDFIRASRSMSQIGG